MINRFESYPNQKLLINILIGLGLISIPILTSPDVNAGFELFFIRPFQRNFISYILLTFFFFCSYYYIIPQFYFKKRWVLLFFVLIAGYLLVIEFPQLIINESSLSNSIHKHPDHINKIKNQDVFNPLSLFISSQNHFLQYFGIFFLSLFLRVNERLNEIKNDKLIAEISYLKSQINPHFLFNTLNSLYALALTNSAKAPEAILKLSSLMRYVVAESSENYISLDREVNYIKDFLDLQQLRLTEQTILTASFEGDFNDYKITPLVLICIIENAFKYGADVENSSEITVSLVVKDNFLKLIVLNTIVNLEDKKEIRSTKQGLKNTRKQLDLFYPNKYNLTIENDSKTYKVNLEIQLK
jgi:hypothetical protein